MNSCVSLVSKIGSTSLSIFTAKVRGNQGVEKANVKKKTYPWTEKLIILLWRENIFQTVA